MAGLRVSDNRASTFFLLSHSLTYNRRKFRRVIQAFEAPCEHQHVFLALNDQAITVAVLFCNILKLQ